MDVPAVGHDNTLVVRDYLKKNLIVLSHVRSAIAVDLVQRSPVERAGKTPNVHGPLFGYISSLVGGHVDLWSCDMNEICKKLTW